MCGECWALSSLWLLGVLGLLIVSILLKSCKGSGLFVSIYRNSCRFLYKIGADFVQNSTTYKVLQYSTKFYKFSTKFYNVPNCLDVVVVICRVFWGIVDLCRLSC